MNPNGTTTTPGDYVGLRDRLNVAEIQWCVAGGQAVNIWAAHYLLAKPILGGFWPFTSKNFDPLIISPRNTEKCPELHIHDWKNDSAVSGSVTVPGITHPGELLKFLPGVPDEQWIHRIARIDDWPLPPPDALYATKCWNILNFPQEGRQDMKHLLILNYVLEAHIARVEQGERDAILQALQQLADNGTISRVMELAGPDVASTITSRLTIPTIPSPRFHVCSGLYDEIRKSSTAAPNVNQLNPREEEWATAIVQFHDRDEGERLFVETYAEALESHFATIQRGAVSCLN
jgi:hypothetical protein